MNGKVRDLEAELEAKDAAEKSYQKEKLIFVEEIKTLSREKSDALFELKIAEKKLEMNEKLVEDIRNDKLDVEELYKKLKIEYDGLFAEKCCLDSEYSSLKEDNVKLRKERENLLNVEERKNYYKENCRRLEKVLGETKDENTSLKNDFNALHSILQDRDKKLEE